MKIVSAALAALLLSAASGRAQDLSLFRGPAVQVARQAPAADPEIAERPRDPAAKAAKERKQRLWLVIGGILLGVVVVSVAVNAGGGGGSGGGGGGY